MRVYTFLMGLAGVSLLPLSGRAQIQKDSSKVISPLDSNYFQIKQTSAFDSSYYKTYPKTFTARAFISRKYTRLLVSEPGGILTYRPNTPPNLGIGATYRFITLNISAGLGFFTPTDQKGKTRYLDLQTHIYWRTITVDVFAQFYRGYFLDPKTLNQSQDTPYVRPDVKVSMVGIASYYVFNFRRFSYRTSLVQSVWKKKSAGSLLAGWEIYYGNIRADSTLAPKSVVADSTGRNIHGAHFFEMGPGIGYVYTFVFQKHYFVTGNATIHAALGYTREYGDGKFDHVAVNPTITYRVAAGYNGNVWGFNASWVNNQVAVSGVDANQAYRVKAGMYQLTAARHFGLSSRIRRKINAVQDKMKETIIGQ